MDSYRQKIDMITSSKFHEGEYGSEVNIENILSGLKRVSFPEGYLKFLEEFGFGELDASFWIEEQPLYWNEIFPAERAHLEGMYIFATDQGEYCYAFDSNNNNVVVEIAADGVVEELNLGSFVEFINVKLNELVEIVNWRDENL